MVNDRVACFTLFDPASAIPVLEEAHEVLKGGGAKSERKPISVTPWLLET